MGKIRKRGLRGLRRELRGLRREGAGERGECWEKFYAEIY